MSFSLNARGATKAIALAAIRDQMKGVVESQPSHAKDADEVIAVATAYAGLVEEDPNKDIMISASGSLSWKYVPGQHQPTEFTAASINVAVYQMDRAPADQVV